MSDALVEFEEIIEKAHTLCLDGTSYKQHQSQGTLDKHYDNVLKEMIADIVSLPVVRLSEGLDPFDIEEGEVTRTLIQLAHVLCLTFGKPYRQVEGDIIRVINAFPAQDYRISKVLQKHNKLH